MGHPTVAGNFLSESFRRVEGKGRERGVEDFWGVGGGGGSKCCGTVFMKWQTGIQRGEGGWERGEGGRSTLWNHQWRWDERQILTRP